MLVYNILRTEKYYQDGRLIRAGSKILSCYVSRKSAFGEIEFFNEERAPLLIDEMQMKNWEYVGIAEPKYMYNPFHRRYEFEGKGDEEGTTLIVKVEIESVKLRI